MNTYISNILVKLYLSCILICAFSYTSIGQTECVYTFHSQAEIDAFEQSCTIINGDLIIDGEDIINLTQLSVIEQITGSLIIGTTTNGETGNDNLTSLNGLENILDIGNDLIIKNNPLLLSLGGLGSIETLGGSLVLENLFSCHEFGNFSLNISHLNGNLEIIETEFSELNGLHHLESISGVVFFVNNANLSSINLPNLTTMNTGFHVVGNELLTDFTGLESLEHLGADLSIILNNSMTSLQGLSALSIIDGDLTIIANISLTGLDGLDNLEVVTDTLNVSYNSQLSACCNLFPTLNSNNTGTILIAGNAENCQEPQEVLDFCVTIDTDEDGIADVYDNCPLLQNAAQVDADNDGFGEVCDCDDNTATTNSGAPEIFNNGIDDNCNGETDEGSPAPDCTPFSVSVADIKHVSCYGKHDGAVELEFVGATFPVICDWTHDLQDLQSQDGLAAGTYEVVLTDQNACSQQISISISEPPVLHVDIQTSPTFCEETIGTVNLAITGGTLPYVVNWEENPSSTVSLQNLESDTYTAVIIDGHGCSTPIQAEVGHEDCPDFTFFLFTEMAAELTSTNVVNIDFSTVGEVEIGNFLLEHSVDGVNFEAVGEPIEGYGFNEYGNDYNMSHSQLINGNNFYRVAYIDKDNFITHSNVSEIFFEFSNVLTVYPNPTRDLLTIEFPEISNSQTSVFLYNELGQKIVEKELAVLTATLQIDMTNYPAGIYFLKAKTENSALLNEKIVKTK